MANSKKDKRGYVLRTGECQRSDGRYSYLIQTSMENVM